MREQGYAIEDKPDLGFLTVGADQWYGATTDEQDLVVAYLDDADDSIHTQDRVLYWWVEASPGQAEISRWRSCSAPPFYVVDSYEGGHGDRELARQCSRPLALNIPGSARSREAAAQV
jgi:hypothetical protein